VIKLFDIKDAFKLAEMVSSYSNCLKLKVGAVILKDGLIAGLGWNDARPKEPYCPRKDMPTGEGYFFCSTHCAQTFHAEEMAIYNRTRKDLNGGEIFIYGHNIVCSGCQEALKNYGINKVYMMKQDGEEFEFIEIDL
jgi:dCMP deaminase